MLRKATLISNPKTGRYVSRRKTIQELASDLNAQGVEVELKFTAGPGDAADLAAKAANNGSTDVIVAGGDGTINEAIQGMVGTKSRLGILPRGTANVLARELGLPMNIDEAINIAAHGKSRQIHFGVAVDETTNIRRHFVLMAGIGLDASVVQRTPPRLKKPPPAAAGAPIPGLPGWVMVRLNGVAVPGAVDVEGGAEKVRVPREPELDPPPIRASAEETTSIDGRATERTIAIA